MMRIMHMVKHFYLAMAVTAACSLSAATVTNVTAKQRYPWNGLVDISCKVTNMAETAVGRDFVVSAVMPDWGNARKVWHFWVVQGGTNSTYRKVHGSGNYQLLWDARADLGNVRYSNMVVRVTLDSHEKEKVQLWENGPYWATTNIGAEEPWESGYYFWWGDTIGYKPENDAWVATDGSSSNFSFGDDPISMQTYNKDIATLQSEGWIVSQDGTNVLAPEHDAAHVHWGGNWRMPTYQEFAHLANNCDWTYTTMNGVNGCVVRGRSDYAANSIFLPCAGSGVHASLPGTGQGEYWSSGTKGAVTAYELLIYLHSNNIQAKGVSAMFSYCGCPVRPVLGFTK